MSGHILICEDSFTGILTGIYNAYAMHLEPKETRIQVGCEGDLQLFMEYLTVEPDEEKAYKVSDSIRRKLGDDIAYYLNNALASEDPEKGNAVYQTIVLAFQGKGRDVMSCLQNDEVRKVFELSRYVWGEVHHLYGFVRFRELENGILYAEIGPRNNVVSLLAPHFQDRFPGENFMIHDEVRGLYAIHPAHKEVFIVKKDNMPDMDLKTESIQEQYIQDLFKHFVTSIAIESRKNLDLQRNMLPLRFRPYMTEFQT